MFVTFDNLIQLVKDICLSMNIVLLNGLYGLSLLNIYVIWENIFNSQAYIGNINRNRGPTWSVLGPTWCNLNGQLKALQCLHCL